MTERRDRSTGLDEPASSNEVDPVDGADVARRRFFRQFAGEVARSAATVSGAAGVLQRTLREATWVTLEPAAVLGEPPARVGVVEMGRRARVAFRLDDDRIMIIDQRRLPYELVEFAVTTSADAVRAIRELVIRGTPATSQIAALSLALTAASVSDMKAAYARNATLRFSGDELIRAHASASAVRWTVERCLSRITEIGNTGEDGALAAATILAEALRISDEAAKDHRRIAAFGFDTLTRPVGRTLNLLTHSSTGWLAGGQIGTALGIVDEAVRRGQAIHVFVAETRPDLEGARLAAWELAQAGVAHTIVTDAAAGWLLATRDDVDAVLVGAETIAANGDTVGKIGTYPLAVMAARHHVPFYICAPVCSIDLDAPDGSHVYIEQRPSVEITSIRGIPVAPTASMAANPASDVTPASLITAFVTEEGVLRPEFGPQLKAAVAAREARWSEPAPGSPAVVVPSPDVAEQRTDTLGPTG